jgi:hypothetical protein
LPNSAGHVPKSELQGIASAQSLPEVGCTYRTILIVPVRSWQDCQNPNLKVLSQLKDNPK